MSFFLQKADELELNNSMQMISRDHLAAKNRYVYFDNQIRPVSKFSDCTVLLNNLTAFDVVTSFFFFLKT